MYTTTLKAFLIHPNPLEREALSDWFQRHLQVGITGGLRCLSQVPAQRPDAGLLIVFDYGPDDLAARITALNHCHPGLKFLVYVNNRPVSYLRNLVCAGVHGCLDSASDIHESYEAMRALSKGHVYYGQHIMNRLAEASEPVVKHAPVAHIQHPLSMREMEILALVASEYSTSRIADKLFISIKTVETHRRNLFQKLQVTNVVGLTKVALRLGVLG